MKLVPAKWIMKTDPSGTTETSWTGITENTLHRIRHCCTPLQHVHQIHNVENKNEALL